MLSFAPYIQSILILPQIILLSEVDESILPSTSTFKFLNFI